MSPPMLPLEDVARMRLEIERDGRDIVLERCGVAVDDWLEAQRHWLDALSDELRRGGTELGARYRDVVTRRSSAGVGTEIDRTAALTVGDLGLDGALPFDDLNPVSRLPRVGRDVEVEAEALVGETVTMTALSDEDLADGLPFESQAISLPPHLAELTLQQVVSLVVDLEIRPETRDEVFSCYGLRSHEDMEQLRSSWSERRRSPEVEARWRNAEASYRAWRKRS